MLTALRFLLQQVTFLHLLFLSVTLFLVFLLFLIKWLLTPPVIHKNLPPSPPKLPILGHIHQIGVYPHRSLHSLAQHFGPLMLLRIGSVPLLVVSSADAAHEIMRTHDIIFSNRPRLSMSDKLLYNRKDMTAAPYGEYWRKIRSLCVLHLLSGKRVQSFRNVREEEIRLLIEKINESSSLSLPVNLSELFASLTNDVICRVAYGKKYSGGEGGVNFKELLDEFMRLLGYLNIGDFIPWLAWVNRVNGVDARAEKVAKVFDKFLDGIVEEHRMDVLQRESNLDASVREENHKDFVDVLLDLQEGNMADFFLERDSIKALILNMFVGGTDTVSIVLEWAMSELLRHSTVMKKLKNEVRRINHNKSGITEADLDDLHYLKAVIKETLRLHPPVPLLVPRECSQDVKIMGYDISAGTMVFINAWAIGRDPTTWNEPGEFCPERFLNSPVDFKGHDFQFIPFGAGRRGCPGILFAMPILEVVLANLVNKFDWSLNNGARGEDLDMTESVGSTIHRQIPLIAVATPSSS